MQSNKANDNHIRHIIISQTEIQRETEELIAIIPVLPPAPGEMTVQSAANGTVDVANDNL